MVQEGGRPAIAVLVGRRSAAAARTLPPGLPGPPLARGACGGRGANLGLRWGWRGDCTSIHPGMETAVTPLKSGRGLRWGPAGTAVVPPPPSPSAAAAAAQ